MLTGAELANEPSVTKMRLESRILNSTLIGVFFTGSVFGSTVPGKWEKVASLPKGEPIIVVLKSGHRVDGKFQRLAVNELVLESRLHAYPIL